MAGAGEGDPPRRVGLGGGLGVWSTSGDPGPKYVYETVACYRGSEFADDG